MPRIHVIGEVLAEFVGLDEAAFGQPGRFAGPYSSGAPAIFADQAALAGAEVALIGGAGADAFGEAIRGRLSRDGVDCTGLAQVPDRATGLAFVAYRPDGGRDFAFTIAGSAAERCELSSFRPAPGDVLHVSGSSLGPPPIRAAVLEGVAQAREAGALISLDPNVRPELFADAEARAALDQVLAAARWVFPSEEDLAALGADPAALRRTADVVVVTRGAEGVLVEAADGQTEIVGHAVEAVDPTGAGDCFCGTFVARMLAGDGPVEAARLANAAAALSVTRLGPMEGNGPLAETRRLLAAG